MEQHFTKRAGKSTSMADLMVMVVSSEKKKIDVKSKIMKHENFGAKSTLKF